jgi:hypothetical protein
LDALLALLRKHAANPDEDPNVDSSWDWHWDVNSDAICMKAHTKQVWSDPEKAWHAAAALRDEIVALGYELRHEFEVGAVSEQKPRYDAPICEWRGYVALVLWNEVGGRARRRDRTASR